jgi:hypothetical protein
MSPSLLRFVRANGFSVLLCFYLIGELVGVDSNVFYGLKGRGPLLSVGTIAGPNPDSIAVGCA